MADMTRSVHITKTGALIFAVGSCLLLYLLYLYTNNFWKSNLNDEAIRMDRLLAVSAQLAKLGGDRAWSIRKGYSTDMEASVKGKTKEGANELLTRGDMESHRIMRYGFEKTFPNLKVVSEEHDDSSSSGHSDPLTGIEGLQLTKPAETVSMEDITVWIDPLDATQEYTENLLHYVTTMVCVAVKGTPTIGVVYWPFANEIAWAYVGHGMSPNVLRWLDAAKSTKSKRKHTESKIIVSRSHAGDVEKVVKKSLGEDTNVEPAGGAGYKVLRVLNGSIDAYVHTTSIKKWDVCAGNAILSAATGQMTTLTGQKLDYGDTKHPKNNDGLLATLDGHTTFLKVFDDAFKSTKS